MTKARSSPFEKARPAGEALRDAFGESACAAPAARASGGADLRERAGPLGRDRLAVHLPLLLAPDGAGHAEGARLAVLADGDAGAPLLLAPGVPRDLVDLVLVDLAVLPLVLLDGAADARDADAVARVVADDHPVGARLAQLALQPVAALDGCLQSLFLPAVLAVCDELRLRLVVESDAHVPAVHLLLLAVDATDSFMTGLRHVCCWSSLQENCG